MIRTRCGMALTMPRTAGLSGRTTVWCGWRRPSDRSTRFCLFGQAMPLAYCTIMIVFPEVARARLDSALPPGATSETRGSPAASATAASVACAFGEATRFARLFAVAARGVADFFGRSEAPPVFFALGIGDLRPRRRGRGGLAESPVPALPRVLELHQAVERRLHHVVRVGRAERRSEERRVGKEWRSGWGPEREKKNEVSHN